MTKIPPFVLDPPVDQQPFATIATIDVPAGEIALELTLQTRWLTGESNQAFISIKPGTAALSNSLLDMDEVSQGTAWQRGVPLESVVLQPIADGPNFTAWSRVKGTLTVTTAGTLLVQGWCNGPANDAVIVEGFSIVKSEG